MYKIGTCKEEATGEPDAANISTIYPTAPCKAMATKRPPIPPPSTMSSDFSAPNTYKEADKQVHQQKVR